MKKLVITLGVFLLALTVVQAQEKVHKNDFSQLSKTAKYEVKQDADVFVEHSATPYQSNNAAKGGGFIGTSQWPMQTNGAWHNRIIANANGTVSVVWPTGSTNDSRGTAYGYFSNGVWMGTSSDRIESMRTGWGLIAPLGNGGEIVVSHNGTTGLQITKRDVAGEGAWAESVLLGPSIIRPSTKDTSTALFWPVLATVGDTVHIFALTESDTGFLYQGIQTCLVYYRSTDNGSSWDIEHALVADLATFGMARFSADAYSIVAKPGMVALVYGEFIRSDLFLLKSTDGGASWTRTTLFENSIKNADFNVDLIDTIALPSQSYAIAIDDNNKIHLALSVVRIFRTADVEPGYFRWYPMGNIMYWNENMPAFGNDRHALYPDRGVYPVFDWPELIGNHVDSVYLFTESYANLDNGKYLSYGHMFQPQLYVEGNTVYLFYVSALPYPFRDPLSIAYWHGVFATKSEDGGATWSKTNVSWLSYDGSLFQIDWDRFEENVIGGASLLDALEGAENVTGALLTYSENAFPSICLQDNTFHIVWFNDVLSGIEEATDVIPNPFPTSNTYYLYYTKVPKSEIGSYNNTREIPNGIWNNTGIANNTLTASSIYPNPVSDRLNMVITSTKADKATVTMTNMLGQTVYSRAENLVAGANYMGINVDKFNAGIYIVNVKTATGTISHKVVVK